MQTSFSLVLILAASVSANVVQPKGFVLASNHFGLNLYRQLSNENAKEGKNLFFSPFCLSTGLAMVHQASGGNTAKQFASTLGYEEADLAKPAVEIQKVTETLQKRNSESTYTFRSANALLVSDKSIVKESYKNSIVNDFKAELFTADFATKGEEVKNQINQWVSNQTEGRISNLLSQPPDSSTQAALVNAVYFKGNWQYKFEKDQTKPDKFYGANNKTTENVMFMERKRKWRVAELKELDAVMLEMPYLDGNTSLYAILPNNRQSDLSLIRKALTPFYLESIMDRVSSRQESTVIFPKLDFKTEYDMKPTLQALGIVDVFGPRADLSAMADGPMGVSKVKHMATIEVDEEGSTATAALYMEHMLMSLQVGGGPPPVYRFDHPFIFLIRQWTLGHILFLGEVNQL